MLISARDIEMPILTEACTKSSKGPTGDRLTVVYGWTLSRGHLKIAGRVPYSYLISRDLAGASVVDRHRLTAIGAPVSVPARVVAPCWTLGREGLRPGEIREWREAAFACAVPFFFP